MFNLAVNIIVLLLSFTGVVHSLSEIGDNASFFVTEDPLSNGENSIISTSGLLPWHRSLYFIIVTITTVGYGDIFPG